MGRFLAGYREAPRCSFGLTGVAKLDFKRDRSGKLHLFEINPRFTLWHHAAAIAGVNIPALVYADLTGAPWPADAYYLINPGTVGEARSRDRRASYMVLDLEARTVALRRVEYDASVPFIAAREAELAPGLGLARLASKLRSLIEI